VHEKLFLKFNYIQLLPCLDSNGFHNVRSSYQRNATVGPPEFNHSEAHVVKNNPLMKHFMSFNENGGFMSDSASDIDELPKVQNELQNMAQYDGSRGSDTTAPHLNPESECIPEENVSITEDSENKFDNNNKQFHNANTRRKLYFNPAYFEPNLLASPPPAAIEFLTKIREVISMAKGKMSAKRFQPSLNGIPEENSQSSGSEIYSPNTLNSRKSSVISSSRRNSSKDCTGCPGCDKTISETSAQHKNCKNCGDKQKSIQKWLENVATESSPAGSELNDHKKSLISMPIMEEEDGDDTISANADKREGIETVKDEDVEGKSIAAKEKNLFIQRDSVLSARFKEQVSESGSIPKIISTSLKKNIKELIYSQNFVRDKVTVFESKQNVSSGHESIYNNPKFNIDQEVEMPTGGADQSKSYSSVVKKKHDVLDQFARGKGETNLSHMPDMIYEAIEMEKKNKPINYNLPTPDYFSHDSEYEMTKFKRSDNNVSFIPFVPTPDYHTYGKNTLRSLKQYQPDSPIYSRKSPAYLIVDYETDSLERLNTIKNRTALSTPTNPSSDFSSQPSPSALPMEEEVEIRNALYDKEEGFRKDTDTIKKEREIDLQMKKTKIKYNTPSAGSMTIELEAISPDEQDAISITDSDQFEPDTLDRHAKINKTVIEKIKMERKMIEDSSEPTSLVEEQKDTFQSAYDEKGRILTLEVRHSKRQRNMGFASLEKLPIGPPKAKPPLKIVPPDVISSNKPCSIPNKNAEVIYASSIYDKVSKPPKPTPAKLLDEHEYKKSQISSPLYSLDPPEMISKPKTLRGEFLKMDLLNLEMNFQESQSHMRREFQPSLIKTVYRVEMPSPSELSKEAFAVNGKKSKDFKNAWKRFMGLASSKFANRKFQNDSEDSAHDDDVDADESIGKANPIATTEIKQGKVKDIIKRLNVVHVDNAKLKEYDSGYLSAESVSNEKHSIESLPELPKDESEKSLKTLAKARPQVPPPPVPVMLKSLSDFKSNQQHDDLVNINIYSSDDDQNSSIPESDDDDADHDDICESGTESWKFFPRR